MISIIAAIGKNRELGKDNKLLWHIPSDLKRFKRITEGHPVIMGRKTFESLGRPLPNRTNIVISRQHTPEVWKVQGAVRWVGSLEEAIELAKEIDSKEIFIIGGGQVYSQALALADKLYLTVVEAEMEADTFFPEYSDFSEVLSQKEEQDQNYRFVFWELKKPRLGK